MTHNRLREVVEIIIQMLCNRREKFQMSLFNAAAKLHFFVRVSEGRNSREPDDDVTLGKSPSTHTDNILSPQFNQTRRR